MKRSIEHLIMETKKFEYISFDVFDTLLFRKVDNYKDIFCLVEEKYNHLNSNKIKNFKKIRIIAEQNARNKSNKDDIVFEDIYKEINYSDLIKKELKKLELQSELEAVFPNNVMIKFLQYCKEVGKKIVITTDMYLPKNIISKMLKKCGVTENYIDYIFISGEIGLSKSSGKLFEYILNKLKISPYSICHIGDNKTSDIKMPKSLGINSFLRVYDSPIKMYEVKTTNWKLKYIIKFAQSNYSNGISISAYRIAYSVMGPFVISFCNWIKTISESDCVIGFVAREGYLLKECFNLLYPELDSLYLRYNKNVLRLPMLYLNPTVDCFLKTIPYRSNYSKNEIYMLLHINDISKVDKINKLTLFNSIQRSAMNDQEFQKWFSEVLDIIHEDIKEQYLTLTDDLSALSKITTKVLLVNNSLNGNAQCMLNTICKESSINLTFYGAQFIATQKCKDNLRENLFVFFDNEKIDNIYKKTFANYSILIEHLMFEECGSAKIIKTNNSKREYILDDLGVEAKNHNIIVPIQNSIISFLNKWKENSLNIDPALGISLLMKFLSNPFKEDVEYLKGLYDRDFFGDSMIIDTVVIGEKNIVKQVENIRDYDKVKWLNGLMIIDSSYRFIGKIFLKYKFLTDKERY